MQLKQETKKLDLDAVEDMQDDLADLMEEMNEVNEIMGRSYGCEFCGKLLFLPARANFVRFYCTS